MQITLDKNLISKIAWGSVALIVTVVFVLVLLSQQTDSNSEVINSLPKSNVVSAQELREEFDGAYKAEIEANGNIVEINMIASEGEVEIVDGYQTEVWNYNGTVPGPEIRIDLGDTLKVNFTNNLIDETTIHWHGVRVPHAMDGVPGINQEPVQPGESFVYEFTPKDAGTFWFHPHLRGSEQLERGLFGSLIVEDEISKNYSQDVVWIIDDWLMTQDYQVNENFVTQHDLAHDGRWGNVITVNGSQNEKLEVQPGERIRLRLINSSNGRIYLPQFAGLEAKVIAVDGMYVGKVFDLRDLELSPGNRIDLDIKIPENSDGENYQLVDNFTRYSNTLGSIEVQGQNVDTPSFDYPTNPNIPEWKGAFEADIDKEYILDAKTGGRGMGMMGGIKWAIDGEVYPNHEPVKFNYNEFNKIKLTNVSARLHPMHIHGQFFKVVSRNGEEVNEPYFRDTVLLKSRETVEIAFVPLDKGEWAHHCHIQEHADAGMMNTIIVE